MINKLILAFAFVLIASFSLVVAVSVGPPYNPLPENGVGSPDNECSAKGFDYGIAKYSCNSLVPDDNGSLFDSFNINLEWNNCSSVDWTSDPDVSGVLVKAGTLYYISEGGNNGTEYGINQTNRAGKNQTLDISHITFCANEIPVVPEFGLIAGITTIIGAIAALFVIRRN